MRPKIAKHDQFGSYGCEPKTLPTDNGQFRHYLTNILPNGPAHGIIQEDDEIIEIAGLPVSNMTENVVLELLRPNNKTRHLLISNAKRNPRAEINPQMGILQTQKEPQVKILP